MRTLHDRNAPLSPLSRSLSAWHPEDVKAAIRKKGKTLSDLSREHGYSEAYLRNALSRPLHDGEQIIARFLGVPAQEVWPDRYDQEGNPTYRYWLVSHRDRSRRRAA